MENVNSYSRTFSVSSTPTAADKLVSRSIKVITITGYFIIPIRVGIPADFYMFFRSYHSGHRPGSGWRAEP